MKLLTSTALVLMLTGCTQTSTPTANESAQIVDRLTYIKDRHGICYAAISSMTYGLSQVVSITAVPCDKVAL